MWHDQAKTSPAEAQDWPIPGGVLYENMKPVAGAFERHIGITLESFYDARMLLDWYKPDQVEPRPGRIGSEAQGCTALLLPDSCRNDRGGFWVFIGDRLQMSARVRQNKWFGYLWHEGSSWLGHRGLGLLGCWFLPGWWTKHQGMDKESGPSVVSTKNQNLSKELT